MIKFLMKFKPCMKVRMKNWSYDISLKLLTEVSSRLWEDQEICFGGGENPRMDGIVLNLPWF